MQLDRVIILEKVDGFLSGKVSPHEAHEWAVSAAFSPGYESAMVDNPMTASAVASFLEIGPGSLKRSTIKKLEYLRSCLQGEVIFEPKAVGLLAEAELAIPGAETPHSTGKRSLTAQLGEQLGNSAVMQTLKNRSEDNYWKDFVLFSRIYVVIFAVCSIWVQFLFIRQPELLQMGDPSVSPGAVLREALPQVIYALWLLLPLRLASAQRLFFVSCALLSLGMGYYWYMALVIVMKMAVNPVFILAVLPFTAIPATLALFLLVIQKQEALRRLGLSPSPLGSLAPGSGNARPAL